MEFHISITKGNSGNEFIIWFTGASGRIIVIGYHCRFSGGIIIMGR